MTNKVQPLQPMKPIRLDQDDPKDSAKIIALLNRSDYVVEQKIDGCHYFWNGQGFSSTHISAKTNRLVDKSDNLPHLVEATLRAGLSEIVLDGEINYPDRQGSNEATKITGCSPDEAIRRQQGDLGWVSFTVYDILRDPAGNWLWNVSWKRRRELLEQVMYHIWSKNSGNSHARQLVLNKVVTRNKQQFLKTILDAGLEGIVLKDVNGIYIPGKRPANNWYKIKRSLTDDVIILGFDPPEKIYTGKDYETWPYWENGEPVTKFHYLKQIGSIVFGKYDQQHQLVPLGTCSGIDDATRKLLTDNQELYIGTVIEIKAMERTDDGKYRHPNFLRFHSDKNPEECIIEE